MKSFEQAIDDYITNPDWGLVTREDDELANMEGWDDDDENINGRNEPCRVA
ncbi:MAG: hypothetical protein ACTIC2_10775 [Enterococcus devriesei]|uniref:hypothetical protein n=1 Tax=Enterococcus devriesei TaxID=319970 RepID=UPI003F8E807A